ncbi:MAG TPA: DUF2339 domain-containing protein, partial [Gemmatimonadales bacterium]|nr:DUF2339 domain-containing protein [Gemmatimonadales bacterium]
MNEADRIERLERRLAALEETVRGLAGDRSGAEVAHETAGPQTRGRSDLSPDAPQRGAEAAIAPPVPPPPRRPPLPRRAPLLSSEQWVGQRLLLAVGVVALILAAGYLLRLSFDRGWISPIMRCIGGAIGGIVVGAVGWHLQPRYRTYGAALIGCGAGIIYLSVWAAARLYGVLPPTTGIVGLALVSIALAMIAYAIDVEALGTTAALGAFFAPLLLGRDQADAGLLLLYLASMAAGLGLVAARRKWRLTLFVVALSYFGVAFGSVADRGPPWGLLFYGVLGGAAGIYVGLKERWWETRFLSFGGGWAFVVAASRHLDQPWAILAAGLLLAAPVWWYALRATRILPLHLSSAHGVPGWSLGEAFYFFLTPVLVGWALYGVAPEWFDASPGAVALIVAIPYLIAGYQRERPVFALVGAAALGLAAWQHWEGLERTWALLAMSLLWAALDHRLKRDDGRWYALATLWASLDHLLTGALLRRPASDAAFFGPWALALWGTVAVTVALARGLWRSVAQTNVAPMIRGGLWAAAGAMVLFGVTGEIRRYFELKTVSSADASLAAGLAVSAWWLVFAAALIGLGFRRNLKQVRVAGLGVAGLAVIKVLVFDLSSLDALYRVGSVFILGLGFLLLAYL